MGEQFVVTGVGTEVGKTVVSAVLVAGLGADYWKPVQSGLEEISDTEWVRRQLGLPEDRLVPEAYRLQRPESPHSSAAAEGVEIDPDAIVPPERERTLIIEGAGGVMVPLNEDQLFIDLFRKWGLPVVLVVDVYLGCINHTLLTLEALSMRNIPIKGVVFNRRYDKSSEDYIAQYSGQTILGHLPQLDDLSAEGLKRAFDEHITFA